MRRPRRLRVALQRSYMLVLVAAAGVALASCDRPQSDREPYEFRASSANVAVGAALVEIQLMDVGAGVYVGGATITATRLDMAPDGMPEMTSTFEARGKKPPAVFAFEANFRRPGRWALHLSAQVPGESRPVTGKVIFIAQTKE
jgi:hypothetical protein